MVGLRVSLINDPENQFRIDLAKRIEVLKGNGRFESKKTPSNGEN